MLMKITWVREGGGVGEKPVSNVVVCKFLRSYHENNSCSYRSQFICTRAAVAQNPGGLCLES